MKTWVFTLFFTILFWNTLALAELPDAPLARLNMEALPPFTAQEISGETLELLADAVRTHVERDEFLGFDPHSNGAVPVTFDKIVRVSQTSEIDVLPNPQGKRRVTTLTPDEAIRETRYLVEALMKNGEQSLLAEFAVSLRKDAGLIRGVSFREVELPLPDSKESAPNIGSEE